MKFKIKSLLLIGSCLLLSASQLQAATVKLECTDALLKAGYSYARMALHPQPHPPTAAELSCSGARTRPGTFRIVEVPAGNYRLESTVNTIRCSSVSKVIEDGKTYSIYYNITPNSSGKTVSCTVSIH